jgi:hypothetical protein
MQAILIAALVTVAGAYSNIKEVLDKMCSIQESEVEKKFTMNPKQMTALAGDYLELFSTKVDCSYDPYNPMVGYNLKGVAPTECFTTLAGKLAKHPETTAQMNSFKCIEKIIDEDAKTAAVFEQYGNSGKYKGSFDFRMAFRLAFDDDYKIISSHAVSDSYHLLASTKVDDVVDKFCKVSGKMADKKVIADAEHMKDLYGKFTGFFAPKIDCSEDPFNPEVGYDLQGVSFAECGAKKQELTAKLNLQMQLSSLTCIDRIVDEEKRTAAVWMQMGNSGKFMSKFNVRAATRMTLDENYKITSIHTVYDSYHLLNSEKASLTLVETHSSWTLMLAAMTLFAAVCIVTSRGHHKKQVLLEGDESQ